MNLKNKILQNKNNFLKSSCNYINACAFLEESIKDIVKYYFLFHEEINLLKDRDNKIYIILHSIIHKSDSYPINEEKIMKILKWYGLEIDSDEKKEIKNAFEKRNSLAHTNTDNSHKLNLQYFFKIVNDFKVEICSKIAIDE